MPSLVHGLSLRSLPVEIEREREKIERLAREHGLEHCETIFEMCNWDEINMIASYGGFPTRYPHWRFGMEYLRMKTGYEWGLQKIYEMVINTEPSYAYLLDNNTLMDQKLVMAHVFGHVDFFQQNLWFQHTNRKMLDEMANHAARVSRYIDRFGVAAVESFLDACLSIDNLIDPMRPHIVRERDDEAVTDPAIDGPGKLPSKTYMDKYINPPDYLRRMREKAEAERLPELQFPEQPQRDVLLFLLQHAPLTSWQADVLAIIREEAYYFAPQGQTKIMNEGWASYWHSHLMTRHIMDDSEIIDFADHHSGTMATRPGNLNPYKLGLELFRHIEERWDRGQFGKDWLECRDEGERARWDTGAGRGRAKIFEVRRTHNDVTFIDQFLTPEFVRQQGLFSYEYDKRSRQFVVDNREFEAVKQKLLFMLSNHGQPRIQVTNGNHANRGELELSHVHEGVDIQLDWARETMGNIQRIWKRPVHLLTRIDDKPTVASHDGNEFKTALRGGAAKKAADKS